MWKALSFCPNARQRILLRQKPARMVLLPLVQRLRLHMKKFGNMLQSFLG